MSHDGKNSASEASLAAQIATVIPLRNAKTARARLDELLQKAGEADDAAMAQTLDTLCCEAPVAGLVMALFDHSPFLSRLASRPERLLPLLRDPPQESHARIVAAQRGFFRTQREAGIDLGAAGEAFRKARAEHALLVALADIGGVWSVDQVTRALSEFADASVAGGIDLLLTELAGRGKITLADPDDPGPGSGIVVLALGKHGAGELNYSSDIDLVVFYDPQAQSLPDIYEAPKLYSRLAQGLVKLLSERTGHGYVHRVDYRLRPDPGSTPVAIGLPSAYSYYETVGQNWERAAFIKARPIAGDLALGEDFLKDLAPFIWRKYFDFAAIADVHAMKRQIQAVRGHAEIAVAGHDIKLGRGGIREIEFFVQTQQLVFGGRRPDLRGRRTLDMLDRLHADNWISEEARSELASAYRFLRTIEHRIQMVADEQTQRLPSDEKALTDLAQ
ncbi:MAG: [protein-PII] uridylyltransferase family protein, partial [Salinarimonas sp.]